MTYMHRDSIADHPYLCLFASLIPFSLSLYGVVTGTAVMKGSRLDHKKEPVGYWLTIAFHCGLFVWLFELFVLGI